MNMNVKGIVAIALITGVISAISPSMNINLLTTKAYAAVEENEKTELDRLELKASDDETIKIYEDDSYRDSVKEDEVDDDDTYYTKTSSRTVYISIGGPSSKYVKVFKGTSKSTEGESITDNIELSSGITTLVVRVYDTKPGPFIKYKDDEHVKSQYTIKIKYTGNNLVNEDNNPGSTPSTSATSNETNALNIKANQWVQENGKWQYNDSTGNPIKNNWFLDRISGKYYYLQVDGNMATGWISYDGTWYYLGNDGAKKTGWQLVNGYWYYLDSEGRMKTGWIKDATGKYYYLNSDGSMAYNTTIGGYKLSANEARIK